MKDVKCEAIYEGGRIVLLARLELDDATAAQQADIDSISIKCFDMKDRVNVLVSTTPAVADVIEDTLAVTNGWTIDSAQNPDPISQLYGWNFRYVTPANFFPLGDRTYYVEVEVIAEPGGDDAAHDYQRWCIDTLNLQRR